MRAVGMWPHVIAAAWNANPEYAHADPVFRADLERIWESWERVLYALTALQPAPDQVWGIRASVARLMVAL